tara:strand:- start:6562 stop:7023 length:462 start_codon:yes stop_codon:yes gene_type:complete
MKNHEIKEMHCHHSRDVYELQIKNKLEFGTNIWTEYEIINLIRKKNTFCKVSYLKEKISGFCIFSASQDVLELYIIFVGPDFRNKGIAKNFLFQAKQYAKKNLFKKILLEVNENNRNAISLYRKQNFLLFGRRKNYYLIKKKFYDAFLMQFEI